MNGTHVQTGYQPVHQEESTLRTMTGGAMMESFGAIATLVLAIAGLAGAISMTLAAIATIVLGASIWIEGGAFFASHRNELTGPSSAARMLEWSQGQGAGFFGGLSGIILGILALLGVAPLTLLSVAVLVYGATFLFSNWPQAAVGGRPLFGLAGFTLGLLGICGLNPLTLALVGLLCLGACALFNGASSGALMAFAHK